MEVCVHMIYIYESHYITVTFPISKIFTFSPRQDKQDRFSIHLSMCFLQIPPFTHLKMWAIISCTFPIWVTFRKSQRSQYCNLSNTALIILYDGSENILIVSILYFMVLFSPYSLVYHTFSKFSLFALCAVLCNAMLILYCN